MNFGFSQARWQEWSSFGLFAAGFVLVLPDRISGALPFSLRIPARVSEIMPHQLTDIQIQRLAALDSPSERLRYLQESAGLEEREALQSLAAWIEYQGAGTRPKEPQVEALPERVV